MLRRVEIDHESGTGHFDLLDQVGIFFDEPATTEITGTGDDVRAAARADDDRIAALSAVGRNDYLGAVAMDEGIEQSFDVGATQGRLVAERGRCVTSRRCWGRGPPCVRRSR